jgi:hypothetical protein
MKKNTNKNKELNMSFKEFLQEEKGDKAAYQAFFNKMLKKFGVESADDLEADKKKEFYDAIDAGWEGDNEEKELGEMKVDQSVTATIKGKKVKVRIIGLDPDINTRVWVVDIKDPDKGFFVKRSDINESTEAINFEKISKEIGKLKSVIHQPVIKQISGLFRKMFNNSSLKVRDDSVLQINKLRKKVDNDTRIDINKILKSNNMMTKDDNIIVESTAGM